MIHDHPAADVVCASVRAALMWNHPIAVQVLYADGTSYFSTIPNAAYPPPAPTPVAPPPRQPVPPTPAPSFDEEEADEVLQALDNAGGRRLDSAAIAKGVGRPCDKSLFDLLAEMVNRDLVDYQRGKGGGYARVGPPEPEGLAEEEDEDGQDAQDAPLSQAELAARIKAARNAKANGHAVHDD